MSLLHKWLSFALFCTSVNFKCPKCLSFALPQIASGGPPKFFMARTLWVITKYYSFLFDCFFPFFKLKYDYCTCSFTLSWFFEERIFIKYNIVALFIDLGSCLFCSALLTLFLCIICFRCIPLWWIWNYQQIDLNEDEEFPPFLIIWSKIRQMILYIFYHTLYSY